MGPAEFYQLSNAVKSFKIHPLALEIHQLAQETFSILPSKKNTERGKDCVIMEKFYRIDFLIFVLVSSTFGLNFFIILIRTDF